MDHHLPDEVEKIDEYSGTKPPPFRPHYEKFLDPTIGSNRTVEYSIGIGESFVGDLAVSKVIPISEQNGVLLETSKNICQREAKIIKAARHDHIITIFKTYFLQKSDTSLNFYIVMDRAEGDLSNYLRLKPKELDGRWIGCLIGVVAYIHRLGIRHRDIKPENILVKGNRVLLTDFGTAHMSLGKTVPTTLPQWIKGRTEAYCAPEVNEDKGRSRGRSADIFSLGAVTLEVLLARSYQEEYENLKTKIKHGTNAKSFATNIKGVHDLLAKLLTQPVDSDWHLKIFSLCQQMLAEDRDQRPLADDMESDWNSLVLQNNTLSCPTCANGVPKTDSNDLITACKNGQEEEVLKLLDNHVSPNTTGAIHQAAVVGSLAIVNMLLNAGADVNIKDYAGQTALHYAAVNGHKDLVKELLSKKTIIVESKDVEGQTPLHCGAANGCETVIRMLLDQKADIDAIDEGGLTPLHFAARRGHEKAIKLLLDRGANAKKEDKSFCTAQDYAIAKGLGDFKDIQKNRPEKRRRWLPCLK